MINYISAYLFEPFAAAAVDSGSKIMEAFRFMSHSVNIWKTMESQQKRYGCFDSSGAVMMDEPVWTDANFVRTPKLSWHSRYA
ncbi:hypothetical protein PoB_000547600 [Plakobranchus ocellatus]|uniref:Uncharacterized protein n=1 Tax=Plakobranchus ocellatus TaxID=259542 RepID=A0AAV3Y986_9GAST|nr:hypothetical protein PoB_000547600 [Plakobranchus ocellatus]